jgi:hypothetical protein
MIIVGCDYHPSFQQIAFVDTETGTQPGGRRAEAAFLELTFPAEVCLGTSDDCVCFSHASWQGFLVVSVCVTNRKRARVLS